MTPARYTYFGDPAELITADEEAAEAFVRWLTAIRPTWMRQAACQGVDPDVFFPTRGESTAPAKSICSNCSVLGGMSGRERRTIRAQRRGAA